ncbi:MAG TPA: S-adenosylmethionine:tRNA ribosyltransferase-isomerase, partial [Gaiellales bacterium]
ERRGIARDRVRLLAGRGSGPIEHALFHDLPRLLEPGDLLVVNTSGTLAAALDTAAPGGRPLRLHLSTPVPGTPPGEVRWMVELRVPAGPGSLPFTAARRGWRLALPGGGHARLLRGGPRLWQARLDLPVGLQEHLEAHGRPIRYAYAGADWPISDYQTVFAAEDGSAEMPSAGRAFTDELVTGLVAAGVELAPILLHTGVSSPETGEPPFPEWFRVPAATARHVNAVREGGGRVIAVGTTAVRALESAAGGRNLVSAAEGFTDLVIDEERGVTVVDGLITGWHAPEASHLHLLRAVAGRELVERCYAAAAARGYLWHEFGDLNLLLPSA